MANKKGETKVIPIDLYMDLFAWAYNGSVSDEQLRAKIMKVYEKKVQGEKEHIYYTKSKTARTKEEREENRQKYTNEKGIRPSFRW